MIIKDGILIQSHDCTAKTFKNEHFEVFYKGFIFTGEHQNETDCLNGILNYFRENRSFNFKTMMGNFFIHIVDLYNDEKYTFTDNSGMFKAFVFNNIVSTSFLDLVSHAGLSDSDLDYKSINEFLHFGFVYFGDTFMEPVKRIGCDELITWKNGRKVVTQKNIDDLNSPSSITSFVDHFETLSNALRGKKVSVDLTGGIDSRLICCLLNHHRLEFELALSGVTGNMDIQIAKKISDIFGKKLNITYHSIENLSETEWHDLFNITDAQVDIIGYHRNEQLNRDRKSRDIDIRVSGVGGELYKDFWWLQDFPFYKKKKSNINRLYNLRIESVAFPHEITGENIKSHSLGLKADLLEKLQGLCMAYNTQTYDNIYYCYKMRTNAGTYLSIPCNHYFDCYAPLIERELVKIGLGLKRRQRFFNNFHRQQMTKYDPAVSRIKTTENISCSSRTFDMLVDIPNYVLNKHKRLFKQVLRKVTKRTYLQESPTNLAIYDAVRGNGILKSQESILKKSHILDKDVRLEGLSNALVGRFLTVGLFLERLKENSRHLRRIAVDKYRGSKYNGM